jgi:hypothetical protein
LQGQSAEKDKDGPQGDVVKDKEPGLVHQSPYGLPTLGKGSLFGLAALRLDMGKLLPLRL